MTAEFYRTARAFRDILMVCEPILLAKAMKQKEQTVYMYNFNQTLLDPVIEAVYNISDIGVVHTSEFAYIFGNLSHYNVSGMCSLSHLNCPSNSAGYPYNPTEADHTLAERASRSWASFAYSGSPSAGAPGKDKPSTLSGWLPAFWKFGESDIDHVKPRRPGHTYVYTIGGPSEGLWPLDESESIEAVRNQGLEEKCGFFNDPEFIRRAGF